MKKVLALALSVAMAAMSLTGCSSKAKSEYPSGDIKLIVPFGAGGGTDALARKMAEIVEKQSGVSVIVENKTGGSGAIGMAEGAAAKPDGYTVTMTTVESVLLPLAGLANFKAEDFKAITRVNFDAAALIVRSDNAANTVKEFVENAKGAAEPVNINVSAFPTTYWLCGAMMKDVTGVDFNLVEEPDGASAEIQNLLGGHVDSIICTMAEVAQYVESGDFKVLAVASDDRNEAFPDVATFKESGLDISVGTWRGFMVPKATDDAIVTKLNELFTNAYQSDEFQKFLTTMNFGDGYLNTADFEKLVQDQTEQYGPVISQYVK